MSEAEQANNKVPIPEEIPITASWVEKDVARKEEEKWGVLDDVRLANDKLWLTVYGWVLVAFTGAFSLAFLFTFLAWVGHYILPEGCHWLNDHQLNKIQSVLFSGGLGAVIFGVIRTQIKKAQ